jgi:hypothetical protein
LHWQIRWFFTPKNAVNVRGRPPESIGGMGSLREKQAQMPMRSVASAPSQQNVINLMNALRRSMEAEQPAKATVKKPRAQSTTARATPRGRKTL